VEVTPRYLAAESDVKAGKYVFAYQVTIINEGDHRAKLLKRHWIIVDADGRRREVKGDGVVGATPDLGPGESHEYASFVPLPTPWGTMEGSYLMAREDGQTFDAQVGRFFLVSTR
jgi:ApaG protein